MLYKYNKTFTEEKRNKILWNLKILMGALVITFLIFAQIALVLLANAISNINTVINTMQLEYSNIMSINESLNNKIDDLSDLVVDYHNELDSIKETENDQIITKTELNEEEYNENIVHSVYQVEINAIEGLRIRTEPNLTADIIDVLPYQTVITIEDDNTNSEWFKLYNKDGYIYRNYTSIPKSSTLKESKNDTVIEELSYEPMDISTPSGLSAEEFNDVIEAFTEDRNIKDSILIGAGNELVTLEEDYGFNGLFALSVSGLESGFGVTYAAKNYNNPLGIMQGGKISQFESLKDALLYYANFTSKYYFQQGRTTISSIGQKYCPVNADKWAGDVTWFWNKLVSYT